MKHARHDLGNGEIDEGGGVDSLKGGDLRALSEVLSAMNVGDTDFRFEWRPDGLACDHRFRTGDLRQRNIALSLGTINLLFRHGTRGTRPASAIEDVFGKS